jgi:hypothetical protein
VVGRIRPATTRDRFVRASMSVAERAHGSPIPSRYRRSS